MSPISLVGLPVSLTEHGPSGSARPSRLCRGCSHPPRQPADQAASSFTPPLRRQGHGVFHLHPKQQRLVAQSYVFDMTPNLLEQLTHFVRPRVATVSLIKPGPSGSARPSWLCRGCSHPPRQPADQAVSSFTPPLRRQGHEVFHLHPNQQRLVAQARSNHHAA